MGSKRHVSLPSARCSLQFLSFAVFYDRASGQTASYDWWLLLYGALLFRDYNNSPLPGTASPDTPLLSALVSFPKDDTADGLGIGIKIVVGLH